jgi:hypothetical protein
MSEGAKFQAAIFTSSTPLNHFDLCQVGKFPGGTGVEVKSVAPPQAGGMLDLRQ